VRSSLLFLVVSFVALGLALAFFLWGRAIQRGIDEQLAVSQPVGAPTAGDVSTHPPTLLNGAVRGYWNVQEDAAAIYETQPWIIDYARTYYANDSATVHMHLLGGSQICPLHLHRQTEEVGIVVSGAGAYEFWEGEADEPDAGHFTRVDINPGDLLLSPAGSGHQVDNLDMEAPLAVLVIGLPKFDGNLYLRRDDPRVRGGAPCSVHELAVGTTPDGSSGVHVEGAWTLGAATDVRSLSVRGTQAIRTTLDRLLYVAAGVGRIGVAGADSLPLEPGLLLLLDGGRDFVVEVQSADPLGLLELSVPAGDNENINPNFHRIE